MPQHVDPTEAHGDTAPAAGGPNAQPRRRASSHSHHHHHHYNHYTESSHRRQHRSARNSPRGRSGAGRNAGVPLYFGDLSYSAGKPGTVTPTCITSMVRALPAARQAFACDPVIEHLREEREGIVQALLDHTLGYSSSSCSNGSCSGSRSSSKSGDRREGEASDANTSAYCTTSSSSSEDGERSVSSSSAGSISSGARTPGLGIYNALPFVRRLYSRVNSRFNSHQNSLNNSVSHNWHSHRSSPAVSSIPAKHLRFKAVSQPHHGRTVHKASMCSSTSTPYHSVSLSPSGYSRPGHPQHMPTSANLSLNEGAGDIESHGSKHSSHKRHHHHHHHHHHHKSRHASRNASRHASRRSSPHQAELAAPNKDLLFETLLGDKALSLLAQPVSASQSAAVGGTERLLRYNRLWAAAVTATHPQYFNQLAAQQAPQYLWIGCSDSRVPANQICGLAPGQLFVHRNIANVIARSDTNSMSVLQYGVQVLGVRHVIVSGHYGCGGVKAALVRARAGLVDNWILHVRDVYSHHRRRLMTLPPRARLAALCELNVIKQVETITASHVVRDAWARGHDVSVHGWTYGLGDGILRPLVQVPPPSTYLAELRREQDSLMEAWGARHSAQRKRKEQKMLKKKDKKKKREKKKQAKKERTASSSSSSDSDTTSASSTDSEGSDRSSDMERSGYTGIFGLDLLRMHQSASEATAESHAGSDLDEDTIAREALLLALEEAVERVFQRYQGPEGEATAAQAEGAVFDDKAH